MGFDFERMTLSFEHIHTEYISHTPHHTHHKPLPSTRRFLTAMAEVLSMFETLGSAFTFVKRDIEKKISIIALHASHDPHNFTDLNRAIAHERNNGTLHTRLQDTPPSCTRTLLRLMWALKFADTLLHALGAAFDPNSKMRDYDRTLRFAVGKAYDDALAQHHSWTVRRSVKGACLLLPSKEAFMDRVGVDLSRRDEFIKRLSHSMSPLVTRMYAYYEKHDLLGLA